jgi:hypothetical protein
MDRVPAGAGDDPARPEAPSPVLDLRRTSAEVLAENIVLLRARPGMPKSQTSIAKKSGMDQTSVGRSLHAIGIDKLDGLARAFSVKPWQLLTPGLGTGLEGLSAKALEVALLFDSLSVPKQLHLHAIAKILHNADALDDADRQDVRGA